MVSIRERYEQLEKQILSPSAQFSSESKGRRLDEEPCEIRTDFQRDRDRILHSKAFRRLKHKTQVFLSPEGDHYRTRLTHTLEVSQIARTIARALRLNEDLTEAIAMGHDLGHTPFGHCGEEALDRVHPLGFVHNDQSLRVVDFIERKHHHPYGLNLTEEVRDGIIHHSGEVLPKTLEGQVVKYCDRIAYLNHDIDDAVRAHVLDESSLPKSIIEELGETHSKRIDTMIVDVIQNSLDRSSIQMSKARYEAFLELRAFMFKNVYLNEQAKGEEKRAASIVETLYHYYLEHPDEMPTDRYSDYQNGEDIDAVKDYIAGMSDRYAVNLYKKIFIPRFWYY
ncbi:deoxyguanosinetriphosphate triphosphohydrolase [Fusibacter sp. JL298sf-3]